MPKIPFHLMPGSWGLKGRTKDIAQAEYDLEGHALERRLLEIAKEDYDIKDYTKKVQDLNLKYGKITRSEYDRSMVNLIEDAKQKDLATAELDYREGKIQDLEYNKKIATLKGEPWVTVINMDFTKGNSLEGSFELDWNQPFVDKLKAEGYTGPTPDNIVNQWFMEVCRNVALEEFDGTGDFTADSEANLETMKRWSNETESLGKGRKGYK